jgi:branched-chain amino acid transport system substrate-binding protein
MFNRFRIALTISVFVLANILSAPRAFADSNTIKVGVIASLSGPAAAFGIPERDVAEAIAAKYNAEGGINGHKIELVFHDDQTNPTEAVRGANKLIYQDKVQVILGATTGSSTLALMPVAAAAKVPVLAPLSTVSVTSKSNSFFPWVFRSGTSSNSNVDAALEGGIFKAHVHKVALFYQEDAFGKDEYDHAVEVLKHHPEVVVVSTVSAPLGTLDLTAAATKIRNADPQAVLIMAAVPTISAGFVRAAKQIGLKAQLVGTLGVAQAAFLKAAGPAANGMEFVTVVNWDSPGANQQPLAQLISSKHQQLDGFPAAFAAAGIIALDTAVKHIHGDVTGQSIRDALENICPFNGTYMNGPLCYSKNDHDGFGPNALLLVRVENGRLQTVR